MARPPHNKSAVEQIRVWALKRVKMILWIAGAITALAATITTTAGAWKYIEPNFFASRDWVRGYAAPLNDHMRLVKIQVQFNGKERSALILEAGKLELELQSPDAQKTPVYRELAEKRINDIKREIERIDEENKALKNSK